MAALPLVEVVASGEVRIRDGKGRVFARVEDEVAVCGGEVGDRGIGFVDLDSVLSKEELSEDAREGTTRQGMRL